MKKSPNTLQKLTILDGTVAYRELRETIIKEGILKREYSYYSLLTFFILVGFFYSGYNIFITPLSFPLVVWLFFFAFFTVQIGGLLHDVGHRAIFTSPKANDVFGYFFAGLINMGYSSWKTKHNMHHAHPNQEDEDPDVEIPFSFTEAKYKDRKGLVRFIRKYQAYLYFPLGSLVVFSIRLIAIRYFKKNFKLSILWEVVIFTTGFFVWFILPFLIFSFSKALLLFLVLNPIGGLYLMNVFAPNHKGMPQFAKGVKLSFLEQQVVTSRNISGNWLNDFIYMGLNYQIEHHLFPNCPRNKLKLITPHVLTLCKKMHLDYTTVSILESNKIIISELNRIAQSS